MTPNVRWGYGTLPPHDPRDALRLTLLAVPPALVVGLLAGLVLSGRKARR